MRRSERMNGPLVDPADLRAGILRLEPFDGSGVGFGKDGHPLLERYSFVGLPSRRPRRVKRPFRNAARVDTRVPRVRVRGEVDVRGARPRRSARPRPGSPANASRDTRSASDARLRPARIWMQGASASPRVETEKLVRSARDRLQGHGYALRKAKCMKHWTGPVPLARAFPRCRRSPRSSRTGRPGGSERSGPHCELIRLNRDQFSFRVKSQPQLQFYAHWMPQAFRVVAFIQYDCKRLIAECRVNGPLFAQLSR